MSRAERYNLAQQRRFIVITKRESVIVKFEGKVTWTETLRDELINEAQPRKASLLSANRSNSVVRQNSAFVVVEQSPLLGD
jgi:hypothetical protein